LAIIVIAHPEANPTCGGNRPVSPAWKQVLAGL
jgi:hypothetical protein